jgi:telomerase reverse transcriptase
MRGERFVLGCGIFVCGHAWDSSTRTVQLIRPDVLNRCPSSTDLSHSVHVMKYIFPRQFGLHNVFTSVVDTRESVQPFKDYTLREAEIARRDELNRRSRDASEEEQRKEKNKLPKRLRSKALALVQQMQRRNQRCSYTELLRHYCPIEVGLRDVSPF